MQNEIIINASAGETRVALLERGTFNELHIERDSDRSVGGMVVLGKVTRVLPGMQAAFVDIGLEKAAFLYVGDYFDDAVPGNADSDASEEPQPRRPRGPQPPARAVSAPSWRTGSTRSTPSPTRCWGSAYSLRSPTGSPTAWSWGPR